jgi:hypothetical protein
VQARGVALAAWKISNLYTGDFAGFAATPGVVPLTGDFNGDGRTDVALVNGAPGWGSMPVALSNGDGTWRIINIYIGDFAGWAAMPTVQPLTGDFNGDGRTDVLLLNGAAGWGSMPVAFWSETVGGTTTTLRGVPQEGSPPAGTPPAKPKPAP